MRPSNWQDRQKVRYKTESFGAIQITEVQSTYDGVKSCGICGRLRGIQTKLIRIDDYFYRIYLCESCQQRHALYYGMQQIENDPSDYGKEVKE